MDTAIKIAFVLLALSWLSRPRKTFYGPWNIGADRFKGMRTVLFTCYLACIAVFLVVLSGDDPMGFIFGHAQTKSMPMGVGMAILSTVYVFCVLAIDANYIASRRAGWEKNSFNNWLFGMLSLPLLVVCMLLNKVLIPLFLVVWISGWFYFPPKPLK